MSEPSPTPRFTTPFRWDSAAICGTVSDQASLDQLLAKVPDALKGREMTAAAGLPWFGFPQTLEPRRTLRDFLEGR